MKHAVVTAELDEAQIRPASLLSELRQLSIEDARSLFLDTGELENRACPACGGGDAGDGFDKHGFSFRRCAECGSVYAVPCPTRSALARYYAESRAGRFRTQRFAAETAAARKSHILIDNCNWLGRLYDETGNRSARHFADVETTNPAIFEETARLGLFDTWFALRPPESLRAACEAAGASAGEPPAGSLGAVTAFEVLEHQSAPDALLASVAEKLAPGGLLFLTTRTIDGFDLQVLWDRAPYIYVPEHLNLMSIRGVERLLERTGFELVELSTPGRLDVGLVLGALRDDPAIELPGFVRILLYERDRQAHLDFQAFLQKHRLSSHLRVAAIKKGKTA